MDVPNSMKCFCELYELIKEKVTKTPLAVPKNCKTFDEKLYRIHFNSWENMKDINCVLWMDTQWKEFFGRKSLSSLYYNYFKQTLTNTYDAESDAKALVHLLDNKNPEWKNGD